MELAYSRAGTGPAVLLVHGIGGPAPGRTSRPRDRLRPPGLRRQRRARALRPHHRRGAGRGCGGGACRAGCRTGGDRRRGIGRAGRARPGPAPPALVRGVVAVDPPMLAFVPDAAEALAAERVALERVLREDGPAAAVRACWPAGVDAELAERGGHDFRAFFADYAAPATWPVGRRELRALDVPVAVLDGPRPPAHVRAAADALAQAIPGRGARRPGRRDAAQLGLVGCPLPGAPTLARHDRDRAAPAGQPRSQFDRGRDRHQRQRGGGDQRVARAQGCVALEGVEQPRRRAREVRDHRQP